MTTYYFLSRYLYIIQVETCDDTIITNLFDKSKICDIENAAYYLDKFIIKSMEYIETGEMYDKLDSFKINEIYYSRLRTVYIDWHNSDNCYKSRDVALSTAGLHIMFKKYSNGYTGMYRQYYDNGILKCEYFIINKQINGIVKKYHSNGLLEEECNYVNNFKFDMCHTYFTNGKLKEECNYYNNKKVGIHKIYFERNGQLQIICNYIDDIKNGVYEEFDMGGRIRERSNFINGKLDGKCELWNGVKYKIFNYKNDCKQEKKKRFHFF